MNKQLESAVLSAHSKTQIEHDLKKLADELKLAVDNRQMLFVGLLINEFSIVFSRHQLRERLERHIGADIEAIIELI